MAYKVRCTACGKSMRLPESDAGLAVVCLACGTKYVAPATDDPGVELPPPSPVAALLDTGLQAEPERMEPPRAALPVAPPFPWPVVALAGGALLLLCFIGIGLYVWVSGGVSVGELQALQAEAQGMTSRGELDSAHKKYRELDRRAMELGVHNPEVKKIADDARAEQERVYAMLLAQHVPVPPVPQLPPAPAPAPETPGAQSDEPPPAAPAAPAFPDPIDMEPRRPAVAVATPPTTGPGAAPVSPTAPGATTRTASTRPATGPTSGPAFAWKRPALKPMPEPVAIISDEEIGVAIQKGVEPMIALFSPATGSLTDAGAGGGDEGYVAGLNALCIYALLQSGQAIPDPRLDVRRPFMRSLLDAMKRQSPTLGKATYARAIRATALALYNRKEDRAALRADMLYLLAIHRDGAYGYAGGGVRGTEQRMDGTSWDNSNSQYGLLGVWSGAEVGQEVPSAYWSQVQKHWNATQTELGTWGYTSGGVGTLSMTAAGTASLFVADDYAYGARFGNRVGREPFSEPLKRALDWWDANGRLTTTATPWWGYTLYGIERVGLASGFKHLGKQDWYRTLAREIVGRQREDGTWGDLVDSAYALLFLSRGRHPILMNKLRFDRGGATGEIAGFWGNRPRDAANLARYTGRQLERPLNWQVVTLDPDWPNLLDSPILSIASHRAPYFTDAQRDKLRNYVEAGGMLYLQADGESDEFNAFAENLAKSLFPQYPMGDLPATHPLYDALYKVDPRPPLKAVGNGARIFLLYSAQDIARHWQVRDTSGQKNLFQFGVNLFVYASGKRELRNRLSSPYVSPPQEKPPLGTVAVARLKYAGDWDPEPGAWRRFANWFTRQTGTGVALDTVSLDRLKPGVAPFAHLTGLSAQAFRPEEVAALRAFVDAGGVVFVDSTGGGRPFMDSVRSALVEAFPGQSLKPLPKTHALFQPGPPGMEDLQKLRLRPFVLEAVGANTTATLQAFRSGKGAVILSDFDVTSGLLGTFTWGISGYEPGDAQALMKNLIFWTADREPGPVKQ